AFVESGGPLLLHCELFAVPLEILAVEDRVQPLAQAPAPHGLQPPLACERDDFLLGFWTRSEAVSGGGNHLSPSLAPGGCSFAHWATQPRAGTRRGGRSEGRSGWN